MTAILALCLAVSVTDGDTIRCDGQRVRIANSSSCEIRGIERNPTCDRAQARQSRDALAWLLTRGTVQIAPEKPCSPRERRIVARVSINGIDAGEWMVRQGYAVPFVCRRVR